MKGKKRLLSILLIFVCLLSVKAQTAWGKIVFAEGSSFSLIRAGKVQKVDLKTMNVYDLNLQSGDIIQTMPGCFIELYIYSAKASIQISENTSFRCDSSGLDNEQTTGELYYGRVRAKVAKLSSSGSFRLNSPSLVAGVRGTDFGVEVISVKKSSSEQTVSSQVFCFEGAVEVSSVQKNEEIEPVVIYQGEMAVQNLVSFDGKTTKQVIEKKQIDSVITDYWTNYPITEVSDSFLDTLNFLLDTQYPGIRLDKSLDFNDIQKPLVVSRSQVISKTASFLCFTVGSISCLGASYVGSVDTSTVLAKPFHEGGLMLISSGLVLSIMSLIFH